MVNESSNIDLGERIESLKAGAIAAFSLLLAFGITILGNSLVLAKQFNFLVSLPLATADLNLLVSAVSAFLSGFLFGITYRYIIRQDNNSHLKDGAVLAFGIVRGLAQIDVGINFQNSFWPFAVLGL